MSAYHTRERDQLDGRLVVPAGRMSQMTYPADIVNQVSMFDFGMRPGVSPWPPGTNPGRTYRCEYMRKAPGPPPLPSPPAHVALTSSRAP